LELVLELFCVVVVVLEFGTKPVLLVVVESDDDLSVVAVVVLAESPQPMAAAPSNMVSEPIAM
jgi:hypothetical protein